MKKLFFLFLLILLIPINIIAKDTCNKNDIKIENIELSDIRGNAEELSSSNNNNNKINLNTKMNVIGDSLTYKVVVKNTSNSDYTFDTNTLAKDYLSYDITYEDDSNIIKPNEEKVIYLRLSYDNKPEVESLVNGVLKENEQISFDLTKETSFINPETGNKVLLSLIYLLIPVVISFYLIKKKKPSFIVLLVLTIIPYIVNASCVTTLDINLSLEIDRKEAIFLPGKEVNIKMKQLAGDDTSTVTNGYSFQDQNITAIKKGEIEPIDSSKEEKNVVSTPESLYPIYMWYEDNTIYWWSEDDTPFLNEDASYMFSNINNLNKINGVQAFDLSQTTSINSIFYRDNIISLNDLRNWNTTSVNNFGWVIAFNKNLIDISGITNWNVKKASTMAGLFMSCFSLEEIDLSKWETSETLTSIYGMFSMNADDGMPTDLGVLKKIKLSNKFNTSSVTNMGHLLANNDELSDYEFLKYLDTSSNKNYRCFFQNNTMFNNVEYIKDWDTSKATTFEYAFFGATALTSLEGLENWDTSKVTIFSDMFDGATSLNDVAPIEKWNTRSATNMSYMFNGATSLISLNLHDWDTSNVTNMAFMFSNMSNLEELDISGFDTKKVKSFQRMFNGSMKLKHIYVGESWSTEANTGETKYVFPTTCELPNFSTSNPNYRYLSYAHAGEGGYLTLKTD